MMKDKLVKTGHKKFYHSFFRGLRIIGAVGGLMAVSAIPVLVSLTTVTQANAKAEKEEVVQKKTDVESEETIQVEEAPIEE